MEFERHEPDAVDIPMNREQVAGFDQARVAVGTTMAHGGSLFGLWILGLLSAVPGLIYGYPILTGVGLLILIPTAILTVRHRRSRREWDQFGRNG